MAQSEDTFGDDDGYSSGSTASDEEDTVVASSVAPAGALEVVVNVHSPDAPLTERLAELLGRHAGDFPPTTVVFSSASAHGASVADDAVSTATASQCFMHLVAFRVSHRLDLSWLERQPVGLWTGPIILVAVVETARHPGDIRVIEGIQAAASRGWKYFELDLRKPQDLADMTLAVVSLARASMPSPPPSLPLPPVSPEPQFQPEEQKFVYPTSVVVDEEDHPEMDDLFDVPSVRPGPMPQPPPPPGSMAAVAVDPFSASIGASGAGAAAGPMLFDGFAGLPAPYPAVAPSRPVGPASVPAAAAASAAASSEYAGARVAGVPQPSGWSAPPPAPAARRVEQGVREVGAAVKSQKRSVSRLLPTPAPPARAPPAPPAPAPPAPTPASSLQLQTAQLEVERVREIMQVNIDKVLERGEALDQLVIKSDVLEAEARHFNMQAKVVKKRAKLSTMFDNVLADTETVFQFWANMLRRFLPKSPAIWTWLFVLVSGIVMYGLTIAWTVVLFLPSFFTLLLLRTTKVETESTAFGERQAVILTETFCAKALRWVAVLSRALPMAAFLIVWPYFLVYRILPGASQELAVGLLVMHTFLVLVLQILGTVRAAASWAARSKTPTEPPAEAPVPESAVTKTTGCGPCKRKSTVPERLEPEYRPRGMFKRTAPANLIVIVLLAVEFVQMMTLPLKTPPEGQATTAAEPAPSNATMPALPGNMTLPVFWGSAVFKAVYINFSLYGQVEIAWGFIAAVGFLLLVFAAQLMRELRAYGLELFDGSKAIAKDLFFYSFTGSVVYGHGKPRNIGKGLQQVVGILCDALFMTVCLRLLSSSSCDYTDPSQPVWTLDSKVLCWSGDHLLMAFASLVAYSFYVPLSIMIAPMLLEAPDSGKPKDVRYLKLYLMLITTVKCGMLIISVYFGTGLVATNSTTLAANVILSWSTMTWFIKSHKPVDSLTPVEHEPCSVGFVNVWKATSYSVGAWSAGWVLAAHLAGPAAAWFPHQYLMSIIAAGWGGLTLLALLWYCKWRSAETAELAVWHQLVQEATTMSWRDVARSYPDVITFGHLFAV